ncbi:hypothetical protein HC891_23650 [Candidatus Gracilibacteria bacterium]|nr:hypothetical protein [Candidatus Gracilibacteria bacterium]
MQYLLRQSGWLLLAVLIGSVLPFGTLPANAQTRVFLFVGIPQDIADTNPNDAFCNTPIGYCTLRAAIQTANHIGKNGTPVTIKLEPIRYDLTLKSPDPANGQDQNAAFSDLDVIDVNLHIQGSSLNGVRSTIRASALGAGVFDLYSTTPNRPVSMDTVRISQGDSRTNGDAGGISAHAGIALTLSNCELSDNTGSNLAGAIYAVNKATIRNCNIWYNDTAAYVPDLVFGGIDYNGGAGIAIYGDLLIENSTIRYNDTPGNGGGIWIEEGTLTINNSIIEGNEAGFSGGGIYSAAYVVTLNNTTVSTNEASAGGGVFLHTPRDLPEDPGPPLRIYGLNHSVIYANSSNSTGSGLLVSLNADGTRALVGATATIFDRNVSNNGASRNCSVNTAFHGNGLFFNSSYNLSSDSTCPFVDSTSRKNTAALLSGPIRFNPTMRAYVPVPGSPALDVRPAPCGGPDARGVGRPQNGTCDVGAIEVVPGQVVGTPGLSPATSEVAVSQPVTLTLSWTHPTAWRDLNSVELRLVPDGEDGTDMEESIPLTLRFTEGVTSTTMLSSTMIITDGVILMDSSGAEAGAGQLGATGVVESDVVVVDLAASQLQPQGADAQTVSLQLVLRPKTALAGKRYTVKLLATNDDATQQGPEAVGTLTVTTAAAAQTIYLPLIRR